MPSKPRITNRRINYVEADINNHLGKSNVSLTEWPNGEGLTLEITDLENGYCESRIEMSFDQADAFVRIYRLINKEIEDDYKKASLRKQGVST